MLAVSLCLLVLPLSAATLERDVQRPLQAPGGPLAAEVGPDDFRISDMGPDGDVTAHALRPAVACNPARGEYLVVWDGNDAPVGELEIWGQLLDADGNELGANDFRISSMGPDGDTAFLADSPAVAYDALSERYLVVWSGENTVDGEREIWGQLLDANGAEVGPDDFRISSAGPDGDPFFAALAPAVAVGFGEFLVVWYGTDDVLGLAQGEFEIFGQRIDADGNEVGADDFRISDMGPDGDAAFDAVAPDVAFNPYSPPFGEYWVVWQGDDSVENEYEIWVQILDQDGNEVFVDFPVSDMGPAGDPSFGAYRPAITAAGGGTLDHLIVWFGSDTTPGEFEIWGMARNPIGTLVPPQRLSTTGPDGDPGFDALEPDVCRDPLVDRYLVVWEADTAFDGKEVHALELSAAWRAVGDTERISDMGPPGDPTYRARVPAVAFNAASGERLVVWHGQDDAGSLAQGEDEVWGQRDAPLACDGTALVADRSPPGNADVYTSSECRMGQTFTARITLVDTGQTQSLLFGYRLPADIVLGGGQHLLCADDGGGEVFTGAGLEPFDTFLTHRYEATLPANLALCGFDFCTQGILFGNPPFLLSNARDFTVGS